MECVSASSEFDAYHRGLFLGAVTSPPAAPSVTHVYADTQAAFVCFGVCLTSLPWGSVPVSSIDTLFISFSLEASSPCSVVAFLMCWVLNMADTMYSAVHMHLDSDTFMVMVLALYCSYWLQNKTIFPCTYLQDGKKRNYQIMFLWTLDVENTTQKLLCKT